MSILQNYQECPIEDFKRAINMNRQNVPIKEIPDNELYILYTKWKSDLHTIAYAPNSDYTIGIRISTQRRLHELTKECRIRGLIR